MGDRAAKDALFDGFARVAKALANGHRAEIVDVLAQAPRGVDELAREVDESVANTSQHLQVLARAGVVCSRRIGTRVEYRLASDEVATLWESLRQVAATHVAEVEGLAAAYLGNREGIESVSAAELHRRIASGLVIVLDVRPRVEHAAGHIPGATCAPLEEIPAIASSLARGANVVAYCRGPYCVYADDAVRVLRARGISAQRLDTGLLAWRRAGYPVTVTA